jgi:integrase
MLLEALRAHRERLLRRQPRGLGEGWVFAVEHGQRRDGVRLRTPSSIRVPWAAACRAAGVQASPHDLRRTFVDLLRLAQVDAVVEHAIVGHAGEEMRGHYSTVRSEEANDASERVARLIVTR